MLKLFLYLRIRPKFWNKGQEVPRAFKSVMADSLQRDSKNLESEFLLWLGANSSACSARANVNTRCDVVFVLKESDTFVRMKFLENLTS